MHEYTASDALRKHMYAVEIAMRAMAEREGEDPEAWGIVGLLHDFDYERFPNAAHSPTEEHPSEGVRLLAAEGLPEPMQRAILGHANYTGVARDTPMAKALFGVDELCGFPGGVRPGATVAQPGRSRGLERQEEAQGQGLRSRSESGRRDRGGERARCAAG